MIPLGLMSTLALGACGTPSSVTYHAPDHSFSLTYPGSWHVKSERFAGSTAPDVRFYASDNTLLLSVRLELNPKHLSAYDYIRYRIFHLKPRPLAMDLPLFQSLGTRPITVHHAPGLSYVVTQGGQSIEAVLIPTNGRMYVIFGFEQNGIRDLGDVLKTFRFT